MVALLSLPNEILGLVAGELDPEDLCNLRLASRHLSRVALTALAKKSFKTRCVMLHRDGLDNLVSIGRHPVFGPAVKKLVISLDHWKPDHPFAKDQQAHDVLVEDQQFMMQSGLTTTYLAQAMALLPNLKTVALTDCLKAWGADALRRQTGQALSYAVPDEYAFKFAAQVVHAVVLSLSASNSLLDRLDLVTELLNYPVTRDTLKFSPPTVRQLQSHPIHLCCLNLVVGSRSYRERPDDPDGQGASRALDFIGLFPGLRRLFAYFGHTERDGNFGLFSRRLRVPSLRFLQVDSALCTAGDLVALLRGQKGTLEEVRFSDVTIRDGGGSWREVLAAVRDEELVGVLGMYCCYEGHRVSDLVCYRESGSEGADCLHAEFEIRCRGMEDWAKVIDNLVVGPTGTSWLDTDICVLG
jgi:hypothetical protein